MGTPQRQDRSSNKPGVPARELSFRLEQESKSHKQAFDAEQNTYSPLSQVSTAAGYVSEKNSIIPSGRALHLYLSQEVAFDWLLSAQMYVLTLATGILDATTYDAYKVFTTKMTGNLLFLAVDAVDGTKISRALEQNVATAIGFFIAGAVLFGHIGRLIGRRRRFYLIINNIIQTGLVFASTALQHWTPKQDVGPMAVAKIALLAFAMAGQVSLAIGVGLPELNTTMVTAALIQLCYDPNIFKLNNRPRTRRLGFILVMLAGHFVGSACAKFSTTLGILLSACIKALVTISFFTNAGLVLKKQGDTESGATEKTTGAVTPVTQILWGD